MTSSTSLREKMTIDILVLDAAPLLSLAPLKDLAKIFVTTPQVLAELRDPRAREHFRKLGNEGVEVLVRTPDVLSYSKGVSYKVEYVGNVRERLIWCGVW